MDPITAGALIAGGSALIGNIGARSESKKARKFNATEAQKEREFQQSMSSSAHQRQVRDLKKAGLNPLLGIATSGASTPSGASASTTPTALQDPLRAALTSAMEVKTMQLQIDKQKAETKLLDSNTKKSDMETVVMSKNLPKAEITNELYNKFKQGLKTGAKIWENHKKIQNQYKQPSIPVGQPAY